MAQKTSVTDDNSLVDFFSEIGRSLFQGASHFWNINKDVGWGYDNKNSDVLLIQFLINSVGTGAKLVEDGIFGKKTYKAIKSFQSYYNVQFGGSLYVDGAVNFPEISPMTFNIFMTPGGGVYTIHALNSVYSKYNRPYFNDLRMDPKLPSKLCQLLSA